MEREHNRDIYFRKYIEWNEKKNDQKRYYHLDEAYDHIHNDGFLIFGAKFQTLEFYFLLIMGLFLLSMFILLAILGYEEMTADPENFVVLITGLICSMVFLIIAVWYAISVPKFVLVLGPEGFLYNRQKIFRFFYWHELEDVKSYDRYVRGRPNLKKKIIIIKTDEFPKPVINAAKLPNLNIYLYYSDEFQLQETNRDKKTVKMQNIIEKVFVEYWNSRKSV